MPLSFSSNNYLMSTVTESLNKRYNGPAETLLLEFNSEFVVFIVENVDCIAHSCCVID